MSHSDLGQGLCMPSKLFNLLKTHFACVCVWSCVLVCVIVHSYMKSVVQCSLVASLCVLQDFCLTLWRSSLVQNRNSWILDKVPRHLVTLRFPWLDPVSELPVLHMVMLHADGLPPLYLFIFSHLTPPGLFIYMHDLCLCPMGHVTSYFLWFLPRERSSS